MKKTGWLFTDAQNFADCPRCKAKAEERCVSPKGRKTWPPHSERIKAYADADPAGAQLCKVRIGS